MCVEGGEALPAARAGYAVMYVRCVCQLAVREAGAMPATERAYNCKAVHWPRRIGPRGRAHTSRARCAEIALETRVACAPLSSGPAVLALHRDRLPMRRAVLLLGAVLLLVVHTSGQQYRRRQPRRPGGPRKPASDEEDYYKILGVPRSADDRAIKKGARN